MIVNRKTAEEAWDLLRGSMSRNDYLDHDIPVGGDLPTDKELVIKVYRLAARMVHPDAGGTLEKFAAVDRAKHLLLEWLKRDVPPPVLDAPPCVACGGKGYVITKAQRGFKITELRRQCRKCNGTGEEGVEQDRGDFG